MVVGERVANAFSRIWHTSGLDRKDHMALTANRLSNEVGAFAEWNLFQRNVNQYAFCAKQIRTGLIFFLELDRKPECTSNKDRPTVACVHLETGLFNRNIFASTVLRSVCLSGAYTHWTCRRCRECWLRFVIVRVRKVTQCTCGVTQSWSYSSDQIHTSITSTKEMQIHCICEQ